MTRSSFFWFTVVKGRNQKGADGNVLCLVKGEHGLGSQFSLLSRNELLTWTQSLRSCFKITRCEEALRCVQLDAALSHRQGGRRMDHNGKQEVRCEERRSSLVVR